MHQLQVIPTFEKILDDLIETTKYLEMHSSNIIEIEQHISNIDSIIQVYIKAKELNDTDPPKNLEMKIKELEAFSSKLKDKLINIGNKFYGKENAFFLKTLPKTDGLYNYH